jgi:hypothetical protein
MSISQTDRQTDGQIYQRYSSEPHNKKIKFLSMYLTQIHTQYQF